MLTLIEDHGGILDTVRIASVNAGLGCFSEGLPLALLARNDVAGSPCFISERFLLYGEDLAKLVEAMNLLKSTSSVCHVLFLLALSSSLCFGDSINSSQLMPGASPDLLDLQALGINPASFLFTQNTMYDFNGEYDLSIVSALVDPSQTSSLDGVPLQITNIVLGTSDDSSAISSPVASDTNTSGVSEPASLLLSTLAFGFLLWFTIGNFGQRVVKPDKLINR